jgi:hypothetical protein
LRNRPKGSAKIVFARVSPKERPKDFSKFVKKEN